MPGNARLHAPVEMPDMETLQKMFRRYDLNDGGTIDTERELWQLTINLLYAMKYSYDPTQSDMISEMVKDARVDVSPLDFTQFVQWFQGIFDAPADIVMASTTSQEAPVETVGPLSPVNINMPAAQPLTSAFATLWNTMDLEETGNNGPIVASAEAINPKLKVDVVDTDITVRWMTLDDLGFNQTLVAFSQVEYLAGESDTIAVLEVVRRGSPEPVVTVNWHTENVSVAKHSYKQQNGTLTLPSGAMKGNIRIEFLDNSEWSSSATIKVVLSDAAPSNVVELGDLYWTSLVILDTEDSFPYGISEKDLENEVKVATAFAKQMFVHLKSEAYYGLLYSAYPAVFWLITQLMINFALKKAFPTKDSPDSNENILYIMSGVFFAGTITLHATSSWKDDLKLGGKGKLLLRGAAVETCLQFTTLTNEAFPTGTVMGTIVEDIENILKVGWTGLFDFWGEIVQLVLLLGWTVYLVQKSIYLLSIPIIQLVGNIIILYCRWDGQINRYHEFEEADDVWKDALMEFLSVRDMITSYRKDHTLSTTFVEKHKISNGKGFLLTKFQTETKMYLKYWSACVIIGGYLYAGNLVISGHYGSSNFMLLMGTIFQFDNTLGKVCTSIFSIVNGAVPITKLSKLLNGNTRRKDRFQSEKQTKQFMNSLLKKNGGSMAVDDTAIAWVNVSYHQEEAKEQEHQHLDGASVFSAFAPTVVIPTVGPMSLSVPQGTINAICGETRGKRTMMLLLAKFILPTSGYMQVPGNLRVRYVPEEPLLLSGTVVENLKFGNRKEHPTEELLMVAGICGLSRRLIREPETQVGYNGEKLSRTEKVSVCIARALLSSADLILLGKQLDLLPLKRSMAIVKVLRTWVDDRGLRLLSQEHEGTLALKKMKTAFVVTNTERGIDELFDTKIFLHEFKPSQVVQNGHSEHPASMQQPGLGVVQLQQQQQQPQQEEAQQLNAAIIERIEQTLFGTMSTAGMLSRLGSCEEGVFGGVGTGSLQARIDTLQIAVPDHVTQRVEGIELALFGAIHTGGLLSRLSNCEEGVFGGVGTGPLQSRINNLENKC